MAELNIKLSLEGLPKLVEQFSKVTGIYPKQVRAEADAQAYATHRLATAAADAQVQKELIAIDGEFRKQALIEKGREGLADRARERLISQALRDQENLEAIASEAAAQIPESVSEQPVSPDWAARFAEFAKGASDESMRSYWAKLLVGEIAEPGKYKLRTLACLQNLGNVDARLIEQISRFRIRNFLFKGYTLNTPKQPPFLESRGIGYGVLAVLSEMGILQPEFEKAAHSLRAKGDGPIVETFEYQGFRIRVTNKLGSKQHLIPCIVFTQVGYEISTLATVEPDMEYWERFVSYFDKNNWEMERLE